MYLYYDLTHANFLYIAYTSSFNSQHFESPVALDERYLHDTFVNESPQAINSFFIYTYRFDAAYVDQLYE